MKTRILPNDKHATNVERYLREWKKAARPIEKMFGVRLSGFDPDFQFTSTSQPNNVITLPRWFVLSLIPNILLCD